MPDSFRIDLSKSSRRLLNLSPATRLALTLAASLSSLALSDVTALIALAAASTFYLFLEARPKTMIVVYSLFALMASVAMFSLRLLGHVFEAMSDRPLSAALSPFLRLLVSLNAILPLALNATMSDLFNVLHRLRLPGVIKLPLLIAIRFIPSFVNDLRLLREAARVRFRGRGGPRFWPRRPRLWWRAFLFPLVVRLIRSADELAMAAELKGLSTETDFGRRSLGFGRADRLALLLAAVAISTAALVGSLHAQG
jgi:energy-coupling factor transport system permease protein